MIYGSKMLLEWLLSDPIQLLGWCGSISCSRELSDPPISAQTQHSPCLNTESMEEKAVSQCLTMVHARDARGRCSWTSQVRSLIGVHQTASLFGVSQAMATAFRSTIGRVWVWWKPKSAQAFGKTGTVLTLPSHGQVWNSFQPPPKSSGPCYCIGRAVANSCHRHIFSYSKIIVLKEQLTLRPSISQYPGEDVFSYWLSPPAEGFLWSMGTEVSHKSSGQEGQYMC